MKSAWTIDHNRHIDVICMGRVAVDLYSEQIGCSLEDAQTFRKYLGGCAGNIAVGIARAGLRSAMFSCIGTDAMGKFLKQELLKESVDISLVKETSKHLTGLVLLGVNPPYHFPLIFYRENCADMQLKMEDVNADVIAKAKSLLITGTGLSTDSIRETTHHAVNIAKAVNTRVIFDLDYRPVLWGLTEQGDGETRYKNSDEVSLHYQAMLTHCDLIVGTEEEVLIAGRANSIDQAIINIRSHTSSPLVMKRGDRGCCVYLEDISNPIMTRAFPVNILNVLGAGDGFLSGFLRGLLRGESWKTCAIYGNASGAIVVTRHGCAPAMPTFGEILSLSRIQQNRNTIMPEYLIRYPEGFPFGYTAITQIGEKKHDTGINFGILKLKADEEYTINSLYEAAYLLIHGKCTFVFNENNYTVERHSYFDEEPVALHLAAHQSAKIIALTECEFALSQTLNPKSFLSKLYNAQNMLESEHRGKGLLNDTAYRIVRTIFDIRNSPEAKLVLGEVITAPGRWSSYPPHHHAQPEIYHYRFTEPQGYGHAECGDEVFKVRQFDTYKILNENDHAQAAAPGYGMYYIWVIRHLDDNNYNNPTFTQEHSWTKSDDANKRVWKGNF